MHSVFKKNIEVEGGEYGNAVLTKLDVIESRNERLPMTDNGEVRGVLIVQLKLEGHSIPLTMMSTHFDHRPKPEDRIASANKIIELANGLNGPLILAGDLNATPDTEPVNVLLKQWTNASHEIMPTFPAYLPLLQIDYILLNTTPPSGYSWKVIETKVIDDQVASDHRPILSVVQLSRP
jgi:endonuclease/exonuclease/phosphatase family metal-dependent hydrolase